MSSSRYFWLFVLSLFFVSGFTQAQINGLDYTLQKRRKAEKFESGRFSDHMFISGGLGANMNWSVFCVLVTIMRFVMQVIAMCGD